MVFAPDKGRGSIVADRLPMHVRFGDAVPAAQKPSPRTGARPELLAVYSGTSLDTADRWTRGGPGATCEVGSGTLTLGANSSVRAGGQRCR